MFKSFRLERSMRVRSYIGANSASGGSFESLNYSRHLRIPGACMRNHFRSRTGHSPLYPAPSSRLRNLV